MIYLNESDIQQLGIPWAETLDVIDESVKCLSNGDFAQPIKPYLRYRDLKNRIIAMPAFIGGRFNISGIKWIASFPDNIKRDLPRAHSVIVLNEADTGRPVAVINTALISIIRTASVTGLVIRYFEKVRPFDRAVLGITGWGPIGRHHFDMCMNLWGEKIKEVRLFDLRPIDMDTVPAPFRGRVRITDKWQDAYRDADLFITCTVSDAPYIDMEPKKGSLQLNVSLRDYKTEILQYVKSSIIVDDWEEVNREKTDIEMMHLEKGLRKEATRSIVDVVAGDCMNEFPREVPVMFNPMGMAVFDLATAVYYVERAQKHNAGRNLD